jgi:uncharacterized membrane protein
VRGVLIYWSHEPRASFLDPCTGTDRRHTPAISVSNDPAELPAPARENLEVLTHFDDREHAEVSGLQLAIERVSAFFGSPYYFVFAVAFMAGWILVNLYGLHAGWHHFDEPPFPWLQGIVSCNALLVTVAVLIRQNRMAQLAEHRSHLDLQINMLTEQKVTRILQLVDELQPKPGQPAPADVQKQHETDEMSKPADAHALLHAIKKKKGDA